MASATLPTPPLVQPTPVHPDTGGPTVLTVDASPAPTPTKTARAPRPLLRAGSTNGRSLAEVIAAARRRSQREGLTPGWPSAAEVVASARRGEQGGFPHSLEEAMDGEQKTPRPLAGFAPVSPGGFFGFQHHQSGDAEAKVVSAERELGAKPEQVDDNTIAEEPEALPSTPFDQGKTAFDFPMSAPSALETRAKSVSLSPTEPHIAATDAVSCCSSPAEGGSLKGNLTDADTAQLQAMDAAEGATLKAAVPLAEALYQSPETVGRVLATAPDPAATGTEPQTEQNSQLLERPQGDDCLIVPGAEEGGGEVVGKGISASLASLLAVYAKSATSFLFRPFRSLFLDRFRFAPSPTSTAPVPAGIWERWKTLFKRGREH